MNLNAMLKKYTFPVGCIYQIQPKGGSEASGEAQVILNKKQPNAPEMQEYVEWALKRVCNS